MHILTDPDTYRARKERASGPADLPHKRQISIHKAGPPSLVQALKF